MEATAHLKINYCNRFYVFHGNILFHLFIDPKKNFDCIDNSRNPTERDKINVFRIVSSALTL